jgi:hypothetical protein
MVGAEGFEPPTLCSQSRCATRLRYAPTLLLRCCSDSNPTRVPASASAPACGRNAPDATIERAHGGYSSEAERLTVAQDVVGSIPTSRPNRYKTFIACATPVPKSCRARS